MSRIALAIGVLALGLAVPHFHAEQPAAPKPPADMKFIDPHVHAMSITPLGLRAVSQWMELRNVERCIVSPLNHKGSRPRTEEERATMLANFLPYKGRIDRMTIIDAGEVETGPDGMAVDRRDDRGLQFVQRHRNTLDSVAVTVAQAVR